MPDTNRIKDYWMATMAMSETREEMEEIWSTEEGMADLMDWFDNEIEAGLTEEEMKGESEMTQQEIRQMMEDEIREWWENTDREEAIEEIENTLNRGRGWDDWDGYESWDALLELMGDSDEAFDEATNLYEKWQDEILREYLNK